MSSLLSLGATFQSRAELDAAIDRYKLTTKRNFIYTSVTYIDKRNLQKAVNPELQIYTATAKCIHSGPPKVYKRRVKNPKIGTNCPAFFSLRLAANYSVIEIHRWNDQHNCDLRMLPMHTSPVHSAVRDVSSDSSSSRSSSSRRSSLRSSLSSLSSIYSSPKFSPLSSPAKKKEH